MNKNNQTSIVYRVRHLSTGKYYLGSTGRKSARFSQHWSELKHGSHPNVNLRKLSAESTDVRSDFAIETIAEYFCLQDARDREEQEILAAVSDPLCLNILTSATAGDMQTRHPDRDAILLKRVRSQRSMIDKMSDQEKKAKWGRSGEDNGMYGKTHTAEARAIMSARSKGNTYSLGKKLSPEHVAQISARAKQSVGDKNPFFGKQHSEATKEKLRQANKGKLPVNSRPVMADGKRYSSRNAAAKALMVTPGAVAYRIKKGWPGYSYCD